MERYQAYRSNKRIILPVWLVSVIVCLLFPARAEQPAAEGTVIFDRYYTVKLQGQRCGYGRTAIRESAQQITFLNYVNITLGRMGQDMRVIVKSISRETPTGELISMETITLLGGFKSTKKAVLEGEQLVVSTELWGQTSVERFAVPPGGFSSELAAEHLIKALLDKPGRRLELTVLSLQGGPSPFLPAVMEVIGPETIQAYGQAVSAVKVKTKITLQGMEIATYSWLDQQGTLASRTSLGGLDIFLQAAEKKQAKNKTGTADLVSMTLIVPKVPLKDAANARRAVYRLTLKNAATQLPDIPETAMQHVLAKGPNYVDVQITRQSSEQFAEKPSEKIPQELQEYLRSSLYLDWQNPALKAAAQGIRVDSDNRWDLARALWKYANERISTDLGVAFDPASKVLATRRGDCTEHAVLLGALARARGLPSRIVTGLVQVNDFGTHKVVFGYHAWTEIWIDGVWVSLDAALKQAPADVSHIALGISALNSSDPTAETAAGLVPVVGNLEIEVLQQE
ncbi:hypothetical protein ES705_40954 [subsurface metagenome]